MDKLPLNIRIMFWVGKAQCFECQHDADREVKISVPDESVSTRVCSLHCAGITIDNYLQEA